MEIFKSEKGNEVLVLTNFVGSTPHIFSPHRWFDLYFDVPGCLPSW